MKNRRKHKSLWARVCGVTLALACLSGMAGCGDKDEEKASIEGTYVQIWNTLYDWYDTGDTLYEDCEDGVKAYLSYYNLDRQNLTPEDFGGVLMGGGSSVLHLEGDRIQSYDLNMGPMGRFYRHTGTYRLKGERLVANYEMALSNFSYDENGTYTKTVITEDTVGRLNKNLMDEIREANETKTILSYAPRHCYYNKHPYISDGYYDSDDWSPSEPSYSLFHVELLWKGDYLVAEDQGYTLDVEAAGTAFTLTCDDDERDEHNKISFSGKRWEGTLEHEYKDEYILAEYEGEFKMIDDNLLVMLPPDYPDSMDDLKIASMSLFYLDFQNEKVYFPMYVKSDSMDRLVKEINQDPVFQ